MVNIVAKMAQSAVIISVKHRTTMQFVEHQIYYDYYANSVFEYQVIAEGVNCCFGDWTTLF
jgi:hypothetical protein